MKRGPAGVLALLAGVAVLETGMRAGADGPLRRFPAGVGDVNRSERVAYLPILWKFPGPPPGRISHSTPAATWHQAGPASRGVQPDLTFDGGKYTLERLEILPAEG